MSTLLLDIVLDSLPPSKNRRTRFNKRTGVVHTDDAVRGWMEGTALLVRTQRKAAWRDGADVYVSVYCYSPTPHRFDLDGALPCLIDAVMAGLVDEASVRVRPPDAFVRTIHAEKGRMDREVTMVAVYEDEKQ